jgi:hypothetical protein
MQNTNKQTPYGACRTQTRRLPVELAEHKHADPVWRRVRIPPPQSLRVVRGDEEGTVSDERVIYGYWSSVPGLDL